jgi:hypothetical protein
MGRGFFDGPGGREEMNSDGGENLIRDEERNLNRDPAGG